jgi:uncharacterized membrane protein YeaQ/YmgE (transglycosylase-associated protein family)
VTLGEVIVYLVIALLCGLVGQMLTGRPEGGTIVSTIIGLTGALLGAWLARSLGAPEPFPVVVGGRAIPILWAITGAGLITLVVSSAQRGRSPRPTS